MAPDGTYLTVKDGRRVALDPTSVLYKFNETPEWVVYHDVTLTSQEFIREVTAVNPKWLTEIAEHYYELKRPEVRAAAKPTAEQLAPLKTVKKPPPASAVASDDEDADAGGPLPVKIQFKRKQTDDAAAVAAAGFGRKPQKKRIGL